MIRPKALADAIPWTVTGPATTGVPNAAALGSPIGKTSSPRETVNAPKVSADAIPSGRMTNTTDGDPSASADAIAVGDT